jgi:glutathione S-transferase
MSARLVTIPFSHFCDKARWALERGAVRFTEEGHAPLLHWLPALRTGANRTVPTLWTEQGAITDSTDILHWVDRQLDEPQRLFPAEAGLAKEVAELEALFDRSLGPATRRWAYYHLLQDRRACAVLFTNGVPAWESAVSKLAFPVVRALMRRGMSVDEAHAARSEARVRELFADVEKRLADGRRYLTGDRFTAADLTFASLAAPVVLPPAYAERLMPLEMLPAAIRAELDGFRTREAGKFVTRLYEERARRDERGPGAR